MEFKRLSALYDAGAMVNYKGKRYEIVGINALTLMAYLNQPLRLRLKISIRR